MQGNLIKYGFFIAVLVCTMGCKKVVIPEPEDSSPAFFTNLSLGDIELDLTAGKSNYELHTRYERDANNIMTFVGMFRPQDCLTRACPGSLLIVIRDIQKYSSTNFNIDQSLRSSTNYQYGWERHSDSVELVFRINHESNNNVVSLHPEFKMEGARIISREIPTVRAIFDRNIKTEVILKTMIGRETHRQQQTIGFEKGNCRVRLGTRVDTLKARPMEGKEPFTYRWSSSDQTGDYIKLDRASAGRNYAVTMTDANGCKCSAEIGNLQTIMTNDRPHVMADFSHKEIGHIKSEDRLMLGQVHVAYFDENRMKYSTRTFSQPQQSFFRILSVTDFQDNEAGERTKKMEIELDCVLYGERVHDARPLKGKITMAVAYPD